ncbi:hypothetical protein KCU93_g6765, partial [Aureobasidium melanogenum]
MDPPASFSSLPPELVSRICSDPGLKKEDLIALRFTSKSGHIHASATKAFGKLCFTQVPLLYTEYSLETFLKICSHSVFGPGIRTVELSCNRFDVGSFGPFVKDLVDCDYMLKDLVDQIQLLSARCDAEGLFDVSRARALLERAFAHLANSHHSLTICVSTSENPAIGCRRIFQQNFESPRFYADVPSALTLLLESAKQSGCKTPKLDIKTRSHRFSHGRDYDLSNLMHSISDVSLELILTHRSGLDEYRDFLLWMKDLLSHATNMKILKARQMDFDERFDGGLAQVISQLPLEELRLVDTRMTQKAMIDLSRNLGSTLRRLTISCCDISGSWGEILVSIQQNCDQLNYFFISAKDLSWLRYPTTYRTYEGTTAVRLGLEGLVQAEQREAEFLAYQSDED